MSKWLATKFPGVRFYIHPSRKHGIMPDKYFSIRYQARGKRHEEGLGWASKGMTARKAALILAELKENLKTGNGPITLAEKRQAAEAERKRNEIEKLDAERGKITFNQFFIQKYFPIAKINKKPESSRKENEHFKNWIKPVIGAMRLTDIRPYNLERIKNIMINDGKSPRMIQYVFSTIRQVWNMAKRDGYVEGESPTRLVRLPKINNRRLRFLTRGESDRLLGNLKPRSRQLHNMALLSLHCGLRAGEIFDLEWADVDIQRGSLTIRDPKGGKNRYAFMTTKVAEMFKSLGRGADSDLVFNNRNGNRIKEISNAFGRAVKEMGFNEGVTDRRYHVSFHTLRHTFASWLVENGTDLYTVKELLGHSTLAMTERYSHLSNGKLQQAVQNLEKSLAKNQTKILSQVKGLKSDEF